MKKIMLFAFISGLLTNCAYKPVIDTKGRSGSYPSDRAAEITDDIQHCTTLANQEIGVVADKIGRAHV